MIVSSRFCEKFLSMTEDNEVSCSPPKASFFFFFCIKTNARINFSFPSVWFRYRVLISSDFLWISCYSRGYDWSFFFLCVCVEDLKELQKFKEGKLFLFFIGDNNRRSVGGLYRIEWSATWKGAPIFWTFSRSCLESSKSSISRIFLEGWLLAASEWLSFSFSDWPPAICRFWKACKMMSASRTCLNTHRLRFFGSIFILLVDEICRMSNESQVDFKPVTIQAKLVAIIHLYISSISCMTLYCGMSYKATDMTKFWDSLVSKAESKWEGHLDVYFLRVFQQEEVWEPIFLSMLEQISSWWFSFLAFFAIDNILCKHKVSENPMKLNPKRNHK